MGKQLSEWIGWFAEQVWGVPLMILLVGTHLFLTVRTGFMQKWVWKGIRLSLRRDEGAGDVSQFGALMTALAATIGTGNIIGVATAITMGGPGAVLWMWLTGVFGIATKYGEAILAVKYRVQNARGEMCGGPMYVLERGLKAKWAGCLFAVLTAVAGFGIGNMNQSNALVTQAVGWLPGVNSQYLAVGMGLGLAALTAVVILGGVKSISRACSALVPSMAILYVVGCAAILIKNAALLPDTFKVIFEGAFNFKSLAGGFAGSALAATMRAGISRGLFSNEAGLGSAPIVAAAAKTKNPMRQALVSSTGTFWDTVVVCAMTGLVLVSSGHWKEGLENTALTQAAFAELHEIGPVVLLIASATFVFSTIIGWCYYGEKAVEYLFGLKAVLPYRLLWVAFVFVGAVSKLTDVWAFSDAANGLMAVPNLVALLLLSGVIARETREHAGDLD
ncbi:MAG: sodium:alanine symporter family protein [Verrucomicrobiales bacterium]|nr:sodium:alanine symporter family protein [Verrucomicrobiales bacterium]